MNIHTEKTLIDGVVGKIELAIDLPDAVRVSDARAKGVALIAHPLFGGTFDNKVVHTLARALMQLGYVTFRPNFRGVGMTEGEHDKGIGEQEDLLTVIDYMHSETPYMPTPLVLAGFSFGTFVLSHLAQRLADQGAAAQRLVFVGTAASRWAVANVPADTLVIHGEQDDTVPIQAVYDWARPQELPIIVIPGADHFFHHKLHLLKQIIISNWRA